MLWEKNASAEADPASIASSSSEKKEKKGKKKYVKKVYYGSPLDQEAFQTERENEAAPAARVTLLSELKAFLLTRRRLRLDPQKHIYFLCEKYPGKRVASAITIKNISKTHVAFKFQTNSPQSCHMRPNGGVLAPNESIIAIVTKYIENHDRVAQTLISTGVDPETIANAVERKIKEKRQAKEKFKIISVPVLPDADFYLDMFEDDEEDVYVERILHVVFLDPNKASSEQVTKLQNRLAEADAVEAARKKEAEAEAAEEEQLKEAEAAVPEVVAPIQEGQGGVLNEWKQRREAFLAQQQAGGGKLS